MQVIMGGDRFRILARPSQLYSSIIGPDYHKPIGFGIFEVGIFEIHSKGRLLSHLRSSIISSIAPKGKTILVRCQEYDSSRFKTEQEAWDFLKEFEVNNDPRTT